MILVSLPSEKDANLNAEILDISRSGIKIKLKVPLDVTVHDEVKICMYLPESGEPFSVNCVIKNQQPNSEYGLHYDDTGAVQGSIDDLLFECVAQEDEFTFLIKSS